MSATVAIAIEAAPSRTRSRLTGFLLATARRVGLAVLVVLLVTIAAVSLLSLAPGSVASIILGDAATPESIAALNAKLGLDQPLWQQYLTWLGNAVQGDLGTSPISGIPVTTSIMQRLPVTLELAVLALLLALIISMLLAILGASFPGTPLDRGITVLTSAMLSLPAFVAGPILIFALGLQLKLFPVSGWVHLEDGLGANLHAAFLPALAIAFVEIAAFQRVLRTDLDSTLREDYVAAARAKGMGPVFVMFRHVLRPSSFSLLTVAGMSLGRLLGGTVVVEMLFGLPGLGRLISESIISRDIITVQGVVAFIAVAYVLINMLVDLSYGLVDPRVRKAGRS